MGLYTPRAQELRLEDQEFKADMGSIASLKGIYSETLSPKITNKLKSHCKYDSRGPVSIPNCSWTCQCHPGGTGFRVLNVTWTKESWNPPPQFQRAIEGRNEESHWVKLWKQSLGCMRDSKILERSVPWDIYQGELHTGSRSSMREGWAAKLEEWSQLNSSKADMKLQVSGFALLAFALLWSSSFSKCFYPSFSDSNAYSMPLYVGSIWFAFQFTVKRSPTSLKRNLDVGL